MGSGREEIISTTPSVYGDSDVKILYLTLQPGQDDHVTMVPAIFDCLRTWDEMHFQLDIITPIHWMDWDELLSSVQDDSFFHSSAWAKVLSESYRYVPTYFTRVHSDKLLALVPVMEVKSMLTGRRGVSLPFTDYCEPIIDKSILFQDVLNFIIEHGKKHRWKFIEFRGGKKIHVERLPVFPLLLPFLGHFSKRRENLFEFEENDPEKHKEGNLKGDRN